MNRGLSKTEQALLDALAAERTLSRRRSLTQGIILHELSNALTGLLGGVELLELKMPAVATDGVAVQEIRRGSRQMRDLLAGLRILAGDGDARPHFVTGDIAEFVRGVVHDTSDAGEACGIAVQVQSRLTGLLYRHCPALLRHAVGNLVRNARRYGEPGRPVRVTVGGDADGRLWIHVLNHGPRIPVELARRLFEPGRKSERGGMGLGLHIAQSCVQRMGGELVFGSTVGATVFSIVLNQTVVSPARVERPGPASCEVVPLPPMTVPAWGACRGA